MWYHFKVDVTSLRQLAAAPFPVYPEIIGSGVLPENTKAVLYGLFKSGKSTLLQYMAMSLAGGFPLFAQSRKFPVMQSRVLLVQLEIPYKAFARRILSHSLAQYQQVQDNLFLSTMFYLKLDREEGQEWLAEQVKQVKPDVVMLDPLYKTVSGSENSTEDIRTVCDAIDRLMVEYGFAFICTGQGRKTQIIPKSGSPIDYGDQELRGSTAILDWVDSIIGLRRAASTRRRLTMTLRHGDADSMDFMIEWNKANGLYKIVT